MLKQIVTTFIFLSLGASASEPGEAYFKEAEQLLHKRMKTEAMAALEKGVAELELAFTAGEKLGRRGLDGLRQATKLAREDFLDYDKALAFSRTLFRYAHNDYWRTPARLDLAATHRGMGDFEKAQAEYDTIAAGDERYRKQALIPEAEMVLYELNDGKRGRPLLERAVMNETISGLERFRAVSRMAAHAVARGQREEALKWYALAEKMPFDKETDRARNLTRAWFEMGKLEESLGRPAKAKEYYRLAMNLENGDTRFRVRARDALEGIVYFE